MDDGWRGLHGRLGVGVNVWSRHQERFSDKGGLEFAHDEAGGDDAFVGWDDDGLHALQNLHAAACAFEDDEVCMERRDVAGRRLPCDGSKHPRLQRHVCHCGT